MTRRRRSVFGVHVISAESTELFVGPPDAPQQLVRVTYTGGGADLLVEGDGVAGGATVAEGDGSVEVPVSVSRPVSFITTFHCRPTQAPRRSAPWTVTSMANRASGVLTS